MDHGTGGDRLQARHRRLAAVQQVVSRSRAKHWTRADPAFWPGSHRADDDWRRWWSSCPQRCRRALRRRLFMTKSRIEVPVTTHRGQVYVRVAVQGLQHRARYCGLADSPALCPVAGAGGCWHRPVQMTSAAGHEFRIARPPCRPQMHRLKAVRPHDYASYPQRARWRGDRASPHITHGLLPLHAVVSTPARGMGLNCADKLMQELGWRAGPIFHHVWRHRGRRHLHQLARGPPPDAVARELPRGIVSGATGAADWTAVRASHRDGYL